MMGFTGTPIDKIAYGKGTFKVFGKDEEKGYLAKYSIAKSIEDGITLPLNYTLEPNDIRVPREQLEKEFLDLADAQGISDIEELNKILDRAVNLKTFLKADDRVDKVGPVRFTTFPRERRAAWVQSLPVRCRPGSVRAI
jgi:type I restriction enzyme R subunit